MSYLKKIISVAAPKIRGPQTNIEKALVSINNGPKESIQDNVTDIITGIIRTARTREVHEPVTTITELTKDQCLRMANGAPTGPIIHGKIDDITLALTSIKGGSICFKGTQNIAKGQLMGRETTNAESQDAIGISKNGRLHVVSDGTGSYGPLSKYISKALVHGILTNYETSPHISFDQIIREGLEKAKITLENQKQVAPEILQEINEKKPTATLTVAYINPYNTTVSVFQLGDCEAWIVNKDGIRKTTETTLQELPGLQSWQPVNVQIGYHELMKATSQIDTIKGFVDSISKKINGDYIQTLPITSPNQFLLVLGSDGFFDNATQTLTTAQTKFKHSLQIIQQHHMYIDNRAIPNGTPSHKHNPLLKILQIEQGLRELNKKKHTPNSRKRRMRLMPSAQETSTKEINEQIKTYESKKKEITDETNKLDSLLRPLYEHIQNLYKGMTGADPTINFNTTVSEIIATLNALDPNKKHASIQSLVPQLQQLLTPTPKLPTPHTSPRKVLSALNN